MEFTLTQASISPKLRRLFWATGLATGEVLERSAKRVTFRMKIPADLEPRDYRLHALRADGIHTTWPVLFNVDRIPEIAVSAGDAGDPESPRPRLGADRCERQDRAS